MHVCLCPSPLLPWGRVCQNENQHSQSGKGVGHKSVLPSAARHTNPDLFSPPLTHPCVHPSPPSSSGFLTTGTSSTSVAKFSNRHVSNYHMHILKMARPFIVDMHAHTHPWDVCCRADLQFSIFVPRTGPFWARGYLGAAGGSLWLSVLF